jgi:selenocysteine lyase/cysteine desulfurase
MNIGTTGSMPRHVLDNYDRYNSLVASDPWDMGGEWGGFPYTTDLVTTIAPQLGADASEIVLSRNTTDGLCTILGGLDFQPGDEILATHHEHVAAVSPLSVVAARYGVHVREVEIPVGAEASEDAFFQAFESAVTERTRLIVFSHITYKTGARLPAKRICRDLAIPNGILTLVDGAHTIGMLDLDLHDIGCDFYAGSGHKWQCGPGATGILYIRDNLDWLSPFYAINSSLHHIPLPAQFKLQYIGNDNYPAKRALADACAMWQAIGRDRIERRVVQLGALCKDLIDDYFHGLGTRFWSWDDLTWSGLTAFNPLTDVRDGALLTEFRDRLREEYGYIVRTTDFHVRASDPFATQALRISTHLFHDEDDVQGLVQAMRQVYDRMN